MSVVEVVRAQWNNCCVQSEILSNDLAACSTIWEKIISSHSEEGRYYHSINHLADLFSKKRAIKQKISDNLVVDLAILFHDIVYNPRSKRNEEDSADLFLALCGLYFPHDLNEKVVFYILETKAHNVLNSADSDLKYFIDLDMSILGSDQREYRTYASNIRREYSFVESSVYCKSRSDFLRSFLKETEFIFASDDLREHYEIQARSNLEWECGELDVLLGQNKTSHSIPRCEKYYLLLRFRGISRPPPPVSHAVRR